MGDFIRDVDSAADVFGGCESCVYKPVCEEICMPHERHHPSNTKLFMKKTSVEDHDKFSSSEDWDVTLQELEISLSDTLHVHDSFGSSLDFDQSDIYRQEMQPLPSDTSSEYLSKCPLMVHSEMGQSHLLAIEIDVGLSSTASDIENLFKAENSSHACSMDQPVTSKLVSSMKGSRAEQGLSLKTKLRLKWAPDVYDPPITSDSHTVKGYYRHRIKSKKDQHKHIHSKSKTSRSSSSSGDRKHAHRRSTISLIDPRILRSKAEAMDCAIRRQESKFRGRGSCFVEPPSEVHLSVAVAEAS